MTKGLEAIKQAQASEASGSTSRRGFLKQGETVLVRIPETVIDNITVKKVVNVWQHILPTLAYKANGIEDKRDLFDEALKLMKEDHFKAQANGEFERGSQEDKDSYKFSKQLEPKPLYLFGVYPLADFTQGKTTFEAGEPLVLETNNGKDGANITQLVSTLQRLQKKFGSKAFEITGQGSNKYTILPVDIEDLSPEELEVFNKTEGMSVDDEVFDTALFESDELKQAKELVGLGFDVSRLGITSLGEDTVPELQDGDELPF